MTSGTLQNCRILLVEDEYLLADELRAVLTAEGADALGPVATLAEALGLVSLEIEIDAAVLDTNLRGEMVFPVADLLDQRRVPFLFTTGYDASMIPTRFKHIARCEKPTDLEKITLAIGRMVHGQ